MTQCRGVGRIAGLIGGSAVALTVTAAVASAPGIALAAPSDSGASGVSGTSSADGDSASSSSGSARGYAADASLKLSPPPSSAGVSSTGDGPGSTTVVSGADGAPTAGSVAGAQSCDTDDPGNGSAHHDVASLDAEVDSADSYSVDASSPDGGDVVVAAHRSASTNARVRRSSSRSVLRGDAPSAATLAVDQSAATMTGPPAVAPVTRPLEWTADAAVSMPAEPTSWARAQPVMIDTRAEVPTPTSVVVSVASGLMGAPAPHPMIPWPHPLLCAALACMRREIQHVFFNRAPIARSQQVTLLLEDPAEVSDPIKFDATDPDGDELTYFVPERRLYGWPGGARPAVFRAPSHGTVSIDQETGTFTYDPDDEFARGGGVDKFTVIVTDAHDGPHLHGLLSFVKPFSAHADTATVTVIVEGTNTAPVARLDTYTTSPGQTLVVDASRGVLANDADADDDALSAAQQTGPGNGVLTLNPDGSFTYTPNPGFSGTDSFAYTVSDGIETSEAALAAIVVHSGLLPDGVPITVTSDMPDGMQLELLDAVVSTMQEVGIIGASVVVVTADGSWEASLGWADLESDSPVRPDMSWPIRSVTKSFVVTALLRLVDDAEVTLDDTVDQYLDGVPNGDLITLRMLAEMSSGLANYTDSVALREILLTDPTHQFTLQELNEFGFAQPLEFAPGTKRSYSNTNTNVLGAVLEEVTGRSIGDVLNEQIFEPLNLTGTVYQPEPIPEPTPVGYFPDESGWVVAPVSYTGFGPSGGIVSTPADLQRWAVALATGQLLTPELQQERLADAQPIAHHPEYGVYGLGIGQTGSFSGHSGQGLGFTAIVMHDPVSGTTIVINTNVSETDPQPMNALFDAVAPIVAED